MIRRPPRSTPFPTRRSSDLLGARRIAFEPQRLNKPRQRRDGVAFLRSLVAGCNMPTNQLLRSEEHTSELQSHHDLVCRLLLEKKNKDDNIERREAEL